MNNIMIPFPNKDNFNFFMQNEIDGFIIGIKGFSENFNHLVKKTELKYICDMLNEKKKKIYIMLNKLYFNDEVKELKKLIKFISKFKINGLIFADLAILNIVNEEKIDIKLIWQSKLATNSSTMKFLEKRGVSGFIISPEITLDEQIEISKKINSVCAIKLFGYNIVAISSRHLLTNYFEYCNMDRSTNKKYYFKEKNSSDFYQIIENGNTTILSGKVLNGLLEYKRLINEKINSFIILDDHLIPENLFYNVLEAFIALKNHPNDEEFAHKLKEVVDANNYNNTYNGFLNKKTIFKVKNNE